MVHIWFGIYPSELCDKHLLGEHNEIHKFVGWLKTGKSIDGWIDNNCVQLHDLDKRHDDLEAEMKRRGMNPDSPLDLSGIDWDEYDEHLDFSIDQHLNGQMLKDKCDECKRRMEE